MKYCFMPNKKIFFPFAVSIVVFDCLIIFVYNLFVKSFYSSMIRIIGFTLIALLVFSPKIIDFMKQKFILTDDQITSSKPSGNAIFQWDKIDRVEYHGISFFPLFDTMIIISNGHRIWIDTGTISYREAWKLVVQNVEAHNKQAYIDPRIKKRLNLESEPGNH